MTIYQLELPFNTVYSQGHPGQPDRELPVADWPTKRAWVDYAFDELLAAGYHVSSAYTLVKDPRKVNFSYRDNLWHGSRPAGHRRRQLRSRFGRALSEHAGMERTTSSRCWKQERLPLGRRSSHAAPGADPRDDPAAEKG